MCAQSASWVKETCNASMYKYKARLKKKAATRRDS